MGSIHPQRFIAQRLVFTLTYRRKIFLYDLERILGFYYNIPSIIISLIADKIQVHALL